MTGSVEIAQMPEIGNKVAILDAGAQYGKVIDRRVRGLAVESDILPIETSLDALEDYGAIIISGGPESVYEPDSPKPDPDVLHCGKPLLGICYGMQLINQGFGGAIEKKDEGEYGPHTITVEPSSLIFSGLEKSQQVLMSHRDSVSEAAPGFDLIAVSGLITAGIADPSKKIYGLQFHPEVDTTKNGIKMLSNFLFEIAGLEASYTMEDRQEAAIRYLRETVGDRQVLSFASGGVDSTVCSALLAKALRPEQIRVVHVDTGLMRHEESEAVRKALLSVGINMDVVEAQELFTNATTMYKGVRTPPLCEVTDPEVKRAIIGDTFMQVNENYIAKRGFDPNNTVLAQGTLRPDLIESASHLASSNASVIKTHHNDTQLVRDLRAKGRVVEPLKDLHKDEVRKLGEDLGLPHSLVWRQPFPGPGLGIRVLCSDKPYITEDFDSISTDLEAFDDEDIAVHLLPVRTVGVKGDGRTYSHLVGLSGTPDWQRLAEKALQIPRHFHDVNRVVYLFGNKLNGAVKEITPTRLNAGSVDQLRQADKHVNDVIREYDLNETLSQVPVVSFPVHFGAPGNRSIGIRPFISPDYMTGMPAIPGENLPLEAVEDMVSRVLTVPGISRVAYDLTPKPPGTTEWE